MGCRALLQGIFSTQGSDLCLLCLLCWQAGSLLGSPLISGGGDLLYSVYQFKGKSRLETPSQTHLE